MMRAVFEAAMGVEPPGFEAMEGAHAFGAVRAAMAVVAARTAPAAMSRLRTCIEVSPLRPAPAGCGL
jgi:hypothetical protein